MVIMMESKGNLLLATLIVLIIGTICTLVVGGKAAIITAVIYCIMIFIPSLGVPSQIFSPKTAGMQVGIVKGPNGNPTIDLKLYNEYVHIYEHRMSSIWFWLFSATALAWPIVFLAAGFTKVAYAILAAIIFAEIGKYRVYKAVKDNKQVWGTAAYINEVRNFFNKNIKG